MDYTDNDPEGLGAFAPVRIYSSCFFFSLMLMIAVKRLITDDIRLIVIISGSIFFLLSCFFPFGNYIIAYLYKYVNRKMHFYQKNRKYRTIAQRMIRSLPKFEPLRDLRITYLSCDWGKTKPGKIVPGECFKVKNEYAWCCNYDFFIVLYEPNIDGLTDEQIRILLEHELMHIGIRTEGDELSYYVVPHDVEDFREILDRYGMDWSDPHGGKEKT